MALWKNVAVVVAAVGATTLITERVVSQDYQKELEKKTGELREKVDKEIGEHFGGQDEYEEQMKAWMKYGEPGPVHEEMTGWVGTWEQETTHYMPGAEPNVTTSTSTIKSVMGGRYFVEKMSGKMEFMGEVHDYEGFGLHGYDNITEKYFFAWIDSMSTMMMVGEGEEDESGAVVYMSKMTDPMSGGQMKVKSIGRELSKNKRSFEMHMKTPDGWVKTMEMTATRKDA